ncbi:MAG: 23S rRNA (pseudouridine(1915)-N(3))-methyltransferase RlmH [Salinivirgaceae bacterium]|jgi:23S rRNA (pseudouridine1915-N3)-methyltransferase|nr:23S rRNA (pseudouridine(1915)-N(3))-methyltransferase RlmH [Salinivirgaceae bacterium]
MKAVLLVVGKTDDSFINEGIAKYLNRIQKYMSFDIEVIPDLKNTKNMQQLQQKEKEGELILRKVQPGDYLVLLDERGKQHTSVDFANWLNSIFISSYKRLIFVVGGPYGFSHDVYNKCQSKISISKFTFSHQMVRLIFVEQFYRAHTILKGEPYHHV